MWPPSLETLKSLLELPGPEAASGAGGRRAAVAAVLREAVGDLEVLLIRRAVLAGDPWSGHVALPGGHAHADEPLLAAARRETLEEVGVDLEQNAELLGQLGEQQPVSGMALTVTPFYFALRAPVSLQLSREVEQAFWVPLGPIAQGQRDSQYRLERNGAAYSFPAWQVGSQQVWGLTYRLLSELLQRIRGADRAL